MALILLRAACLRRLIVRRGWILRLVVYAILRLLLSSCSTPFTLLCREDAILNAQRGSNSFQPCPQQRLEEIARSERFHKEWKGNVEQENVRGNFRKGVVESEPDRKQTRNSQVYKRER
mmetsp:Transcript_9724/g.22168  ORF Transcript_9724/g.22168 Transcript_9724/m.22168 type:complete len:119 (-) Transcript_9724:106-462(-)